MKRISTYIGLCFAFLLLCSVGLQAQRTISGTITDGSSNEPLIGANVLVDGTTTGTITDLDGNYTITLPEGYEVLEISYAGFATQRVPVGNDNIVNIGLAIGEVLDEIVVTGYGSQRQKEVTSAVVKIGEEDFNKGPISDPAQLLQGKVAGLQVYNKGGDPNSASTIRLRGISTVGSNSEPLIVVDGIVGASLDNVDPNDIQDINVLKDGSAAAIYGSRGSSGVILVTTKKGTEGKVKITYNGQLASSTPVNGIPIMNRQDFIATGGTDLGSDTDWIDEVTRNGLSHFHSIAASGGSGNTTYRVSANLRNEEGILLNSGFDQFNTRVNLSTRALNDKLKLSFNSSFTNRDQQFGFSEALRYAIVYNPTAPVLGTDAPFAFNADQFGGYFETLGLFDSFNPVSIIQQNSNTGERREFNYGANVDYSLTDNITISGRVAQQNTSLNTEQYYPTTSLFRGGAVSPTRKGLARLYDQQNSFNLYEAFGTIVNPISDNIDFTATLNFKDNFLEIGDFPNNDRAFVNIIETSQDLNNAGFIDANSNASPDDKIIAFFGRANLVFNDNIFVNASLRREGSSKLGSENKWGTFPAFGIGADLSNLFDIGGLDLLKVRLGYGVTGSLPAENGLSQEIRTINNDASGGVTTSLERAANPDLKWEQKAETNLGFEFARGKFSGTLDLYNRDISDFILERTVDVAVFGVDKRVENAGDLNTRGAELALDFNVFSPQEKSFGWTTGIVLSTYKTVLDSFIIDNSLRANLGSPGQNDTQVIRVKQGEEVGNIWGPVFEGVNDDGTARFQDINGDGVLNTGQSQALDEGADFTTLGNGIPDLEIGWNNQLNFGPWQVNAFFRGAFGHSLVNTFRAFYEPVIASQSSYNYVNTSLREPNLTEARFSSHYVEKADFFKLDNLTLGRTFDMSGDSGIGSVGLSLNVRNAFVITNYTGSDPEPALTDRGAGGNGGDIGLDQDPLSPGLDRRYNYFSARTFTLGLNVNF